MCVFYIIKRLSNTEHWQVYHASNTSAPQTDYLQLSTNEATVDANTRWNDTAPGTNSIVVGSHASVNTEDDNYIAYIFSQNIPSPLLRTPSFPLFSHPVFPVGFP